MLSRDRANAMLMSAVILCVGLAGILTFVLMRDADPARVLDIALADPDVKREIVSELVTMSYGVYDSHPDPDVGRLFQPNIDKQQGSLGSIRTNAIGFREKAFSLPKPPGTLRVVLLGDSYVYGNKVETNQRVGAYLERFLNDRSRARDTVVECLHIGIPSWNILAECAYVRRTITDYQPDLVVQVVVPNDLDDQAGVRGFGVLSTFSPRNPQYGSSLITRAHGTMTGVRSKNFYLLEALDHESRSRYQASREAIADLADIVEATGGRYVLLLNWMTSLKTGTRELATGLDEAQILPLPYSFFLDPSLKIAPTDGHWSPLGHQRIALNLYAFIQRHQLLPSLSLPVWDEADKVHDALAADVLEQLAQTRPGPKPERSVLNFLDWTVETVDQIYGGIYGAMVTPRASLVLAVNGGGRLRIEGQFLDSPAMATATISVQVDGRELSRIAYEPGRPLLHEVALPADLAARDYLNVRILTDDFIHGGNDGRITLSLGMSSISIVP